MSNEDKLKVKQYKNLKKTDKEIQKLRDLEKSLIDRIKNTLDLEDQVKSEMKEVKDVRAEILHKSDDIQYVRKLRKGNMTAEELR